MKRKILLIVDAFPPDKGGRAEKVERRVRYLTINGWDVDVLAPLSETAPIRLKEIWLNGQLVRIIRTDYFLRKRIPSLKHNVARRINTDSDSIVSRLLDIFFVPKGYIRWLPYAIIQGYKLALDADIIFSLNNPITHHLIGWFLHLATQKPWVMELRDPIVNYEYSRRGPELVNRTLEKIFFRSATRILFWQDTGIEDLTTRYPSHMAGRFVGLFPIGYDPARFEGYRATNPVTRNGPLVCTYTGSFYGNSITPIPLFHALSTCITEYSLSPDDIQLYFAGDWSDLYDDIIAELGIQPYIRYMGWISHQKCLELWSASDVLILMLGNKEAYKGLLPTKLWDYIAAQKRILCLLPPHSKTGQIISNHQLGMLIDAQDTESIAHVLNQLRLEKQLGKLNSSSSHSPPDKWSCVPMENQIAKVLEAIVKDKTYKTL